MSNENIAETEQDSVKEILFSEFLETVPPYQIFYVKNLFKLSGFKLLNKPDIQLHCDTCQGVRIFFSENDTHPQGEDGAIVVAYLCRNCRKEPKYFALLTNCAKVEHGERNGIVLKIGEAPPFGPPTPPRVMSLVGPDRDLFLRGRRAENQGLGVGAFAYYRRVVEDQRGRLLGEIGKVAKRVGASQENIDRFAAAAKETQFGKAIDDVKDVFPQSLLIRGHNPLTLLHSALSEGIHAGTDEECLELATSIRVVLTELSERISEALKDEIELSNAVSRLMQKKPKAS